MNATVLALALPLLATTAPIGAPIGAPQDQEASPEAFRLRPGKATVPEEPVVLPMKMRGSQPGVEVWVNGEGPFFFAIDTGGQGSARVDVSLIEKLGLEVVGEVTGGDPSGRAGVSMAVVELESLLVGDAVFEDVRAISRDYNAHGRSLPRIDGILGYHLFADHVLTLDYAGKQVRIERGPLRAPKGAMLVELTNDPDSVPTARAGIAGIEIENLMIDTGKMGGLMLPPAFVEKLTLIGEPKVVGRGRTITGEFEYKRATVEGTFVLGGLRLENPGVEFAEVMKFAVLGSSTLADQVLTVDQASKTMWIRTPAREAELRAAEDEESAPRPPRIP